MLVIDASALLGAADPDRPEWMVALEDARRHSGLQAPALIASEVCQVIHRKRPMQFGPTPAARAAAAELILSQAELVPSDPAQRAVAGELTVLGLSFYDAEYVALAQRNGADLVTHDQDMARIGQRVLGKGRVMDLEGLRRRMKHPAAS